MSRQVKSETVEFVIDNEQEATDIIEEYKVNQAVDGYTLTKYNTTYKSKKDRKTGEIINEYWITSIKKEYEIY